MGRDRKFLSFVAAFCSLALASLTGSGLALAEDAAKTCDRAAFAATITGVSTTLTSLSDANKKTFQEKLLKLKAKKGWPDSVYLTQAAQFVQDEQISAFDATGAALLAQIRQLSGGDVAASEEKRCALLTDLKSYTNLLVANAVSKWAHMQEKIDQALKSDVQAKAAQ
jgi:hypothetical protein